MADISKIVLPSGDEYDIKDSVARQITLVAVYTSATQDLEIKFEAPSNVDNTEY